MAFFRVVIGGENFPGQLVGEAGPVGFYTIRFVEAADAETAADVALQTLRAESKLQPYWPSSGPARVFFEEIEVGYSSRRLKNGRLTVCRSSNQGSHGTRWNMLTTNPLRTEPQGRFTTDGVAEPP